MLDARPVTDSPRPSPRRSLRRALDLRGDGPPPPWVVVPVLWVLGVAAAQLRLFSLDQPWSARAWAVMLLAPVAFCVGSFVVVRALRGVPQLTTLPDRSGEPSRRLRLVLLACVLIGFAELAHQFAGAGGIPLLSSDIDAVRVRQPGGPTVVLTDLLTVATIVALVAPRKLLARAAVPEITLAVVASAGFLLAGGRGPVVVGLVAAFVARSLYWRRVRWLLTVVGSVIVLALLIGSFYARTSQHKTDPFESELYEQVLPRSDPLTKAYLPLHVGLAFNFSVMARLADSFPTPDPWGRGRYSLSGFDAVVPDTRTVGTVALRYTSPFVTATAAAPYWADGGYIGVAVGMFAFGGLLSACFVLARRRPGLLTASLGGYAWYIAAFGLYANLLTDHPDWVVVALALVAVTALAHRRAWALRDGARAIRTALAARRLRPVVPIVVAALALACVGAVLAEAMPGPRTPEPVRWAAPPSSTVDLGVVPSPGVADDDIRFVSSSSGAIVQLVDVRPGRFRVSRVTGGSSEASVEVPRGASLPATAVVGRGGGLSLVTAVAGDGPSGDLRTIDVVGRDVSSGRVTVRQRVIVPAGARMRRIDWLVARPGDDSGVVALLRSSAGDPYAARLPLDGPATSEARLIALPVSLGALSPSAWTVSSLGSRTGPADIMLVLRDGSSGDAELHQLDGRAGLRAFRLERTLGTGALSPSVQVVTGSVGGRQGYFLIDHRVGTARFFGTS